MTEPNPAGVDPSVLPAESFTASDRARIELGCAIASVASRLERMALMLGEDEAVAGDYLDQACTVQRCYDDVVRQAVIAERVRGTGWERIGKEFRIDAEAAQKRWGADVEDWKGRTKTRSVYVRDPGGHAASVDRYLATGRAYQSSSIVRQPLSAVLDAAALLTGRDVTAADRAFAGTPVCGHCPG